MIRSKFTLEELRRREQECLAEAKRGLRTPKWNKTEGQVELDNQKYIAVQTALGHVYTELIFYRESDASYNEPTT